MKCDEVMTSSPKCCVPSDTVVTAAKLMKKEDVGAVLVCEDRQVRKLVGIITDRDLVVNVLAEAHDPNRTKVQDVMTRAPFACRADNDVEAALELMSRYQVRRIPVVGKRGELIGIISQADVAIRTGNPERTAEVLSQISKPSVMHAA